MTTQMQGPKRVDDYPSCADASGSRHDVGSEKSAGDDMYGLALFKFRLIEALPSDVAIRSVSHPRSERRWRSAGRVNPRPGSFAARPGIYVLPLAHQSRTTCCNLNDVVCNLLYAV